MSNFGAVNYSKRISHQCLIRLQAVYETLKSAERCAADVLLQSPEVIASSTIVEAASIAGCSEATLVRLARKLGYVGFPELKNSLISDSGGSELLYTGLTGTDSDMSVVRKVFQNSIQSLEDTLNLVEDFVYEQACGMLKNAGRILFIGSGDAYTVAYAGYLKFSRIGFNVCCTKDFDVQMIEASRLQRGDVLLTVSHSGRTRTVCEVAKLAKSRGAGIVTITNYPISPLAKLADALLLTATFVPNTFGEIMTKRIPEFCLMETLYVNAARALNEQQRGILQCANDSIAANKI